MEKEVIWSPTAKRSFSKVIEYLKEAWTEKEVLRFVAKTEKIVELIRSGNVKFRPAGKRDVREILVTKHNLLIYRIQKGHVELLRFYDTRQNPKKKKF